MVDSGKLFNQAMTALERGNRRLARDRLERVLADRPFDTQAAVALAQMLREDLDPAQAEKVLVQVIMVCEGQLRAEAGGGQAPAARSETTGATRAARGERPEQIPVGPPRTEEVDTTEAYLELADLRLASKRPAEAARALKRLLAQQPSNWEALYLLGNAFLDAKAPAEARNAYREALASNPFEAEVWFNLGVACEQLGDTEGAAEAFASHAKWKASGVDT